MWVPTIIRMEAVVDQLGAESTGGRLILEGLANVRRLMPLAAEAGVLLLAGTDVTVGAHDVALEAQKMVSYGLPAEDALRAVSGDGYRAAHRADPFAVGSPADVVIFDVNPIEELGALSHPAKVVRLGRVVQG
jgi:imidazolonepropionase-like amidohydrolase